jgi:hypothetical protein
MGCTGVMGVTGPTSLDGRTDVEECQQMKVKFFKGRQYEILIQFAEDSPKDAMFVIGGEQVPFAAIQAAVRAFTDKHADALEL